MKEKKYRQRPPTAPCALCGEVNKLCKSHIVPKSFIRELRAYDKKMYWYDLRTKQKPKSTQDGWKEHLLCNSCEQLFGIWEKVVCEDLRGKGRASARRRVIPYDGPIVIPPTAPRPAFHALETQDCRYTEWRLFLLSLLWRMDRSTLPELAAVDLGDVRADIQQMNLASNPGEPMDYPCWIYILSLSGEPMRGFMNSPHQFKYKGYQAIELAFAGMGWLFIVSRDVACETMQKFVLDRKGKMWLMFREATAVPWLMQGIKRLDTLENWAE